jgi:PilZ domain-containing protein
VEQRRSDRELVRWQGRYLLEGGWSYWAECQVIDISSEGLGVELVGEMRGDDIVGHHITLVMEARLGVRGLVGVRLEGFVRNATPLWEGGALRAGIEFEDVSDNGRAVLDDILRSRWLGE